MRGREKLMMAPRFLPGAIYYDGKDLNFHLECIHFDMPLRHWDRDDV